MQRSALCRSRRELSNAYSLAKIGFDTAENEPCEVCPLSENTQPRTNESVGDEVVWSTRVSRSSLPSSCLFTWARWCRSSSASSWACLCLFFQAEAVCTQVWKIPSHNNLCIWAYVQNDLEVCTSGQEIRKVMLRVKVMRTPLQILFLILVTDLPPSAVSQSFFEKKNSAQRAEFLQTLQQSVPVHEQRRTAVTKMFSYFY